MRKAWFLFLLLGAGMALLGIKQYHQQDLTETISSSICPECLGVRVTQEEILYEKGVEIGFKEGRFDILTRTDIGLLCKGLNRGKRSFTMILFFTDCNGCLFAKKLVSEIAYVNPLHFRMEILGQESEAFEEAKAKYGFSEIYPSLFLVDGHGNVRASVEGTQNLKERVIEFILRLEGVA